MAVAVREVTFNSIQDQLGITTTKKNVNGKLSILSKINFTADVKFKDPITFLSILSRINQSQQPQQGGGGGVLAFNSIQDQHRTS